MFQIVRLALDDNGEVTARRPLQPCFELWEDAVAMAEFDASRLWGDYGCDEERDCWWATDTRGRKYRFVIEQVRPTDIELGSSAWHCCQPLGNLRGPDVAGHADHAIFGQSQIRSRDQAGRGRRIRNGSRRSSARRPRESHQ